jgi:DHA1 family bicyclomycin/chloramphenicol resistance-like MFS transporter
MKVPGTDTQQNTAGSSIGLSLGEFVSLMAALTALVALSIDMLLPALPAIGSTLGVERPNDNQLVIAVFFLGFGVGQLFYGSFSDSAGRKPAVYLGLGFYFIGSVLSLLSQTLSVMLAGRVLQGFGVAGPRTITIALVRDKFDGRSMARVMSIIMAIFILIPIVAPALGQAVLSVASWRTIFGIYMTMAVVVGVWFGLRQEETLAKDRRMPFTAARVIGAVREVVTKRAVLGYTVAAGCVYGALLGYLNSVQQILQQLYGLGARFPLYFAMLAVTVGSASSLNATLVMRYGMQRLSTWSISTVCATSVVFLGIASFLGGQPPLWALMSYLMLSFFGVGLTFSNLTALAMHPLGNVAGTGAAVVGAMATLLSMVWGTEIGQSYNGTVLPLVAGFAILSALALVATRWATREAMTVRAEQDPQPK